MINGSDGGGVSYSGVDLAQPSNVAAQVAQALLYGNGVHTGTDRSAANVLGLGVPANPA